MHSSAISQTAWKSVTRLLVLLAALSLPAVHAQSLPAPLVERARGAERVVVGRVASTGAIWRVNEHGDRLIVTIVRLVAGETLKGQPQPTLDIELEGGTIGDLTLKVSDLPSVAAGERAIFYLQRNILGALVPYRRGDGILKLDQRDRIAGSATTLDEVRRTVAAAASR
jgi:hypothetical protein